MNFSLKNTAYLGSLTSLSAAAPNVIDVSDPDFWFEADAITGKVNNDAITSLVDLSGNGNDLESVNGPVYKISVIKGLPALRFDGINDSIYRATFTQGTWNQPSSFLVVYREDTTEDASGFIFDSRNLSNRNAMLTQPFAAPDSVFLFAGGGAYGVVTAPKNRWRVGVVRFNGTSSKLSLNGTDSGWAPDPGVQAMIGLTIGAQADGAAYFLRGYIAVLIGWNRLLSDDEVLEFSTAMMSKYNDSDYTGTRACGFGGAAFNRFTGGGALAQPTAWSAGGWVRLPAPAQANFTIFLRSNGSPDSAYSHYLYTAAATQQFAVTMFDGAGKNVTGTTTIVPDQWYHVIAACTNGGTLKLYVNGVSEGTPAAVGTMWNSGNDWWFGRNVAGMTSFMGSMSDMTIWNRELTAGEITTLAGSAIGAAGSLHPADHIVRLPMQDGTMNEAIGADWTESVGGLTQTRTADVTVERGKT
jgi:hypothetical protein